MAIRRGTHGYHCWSSNLEGWACAYHSACQWRDFGEVCVVPTVGDLLNREPGQGWRRGAGRALAVALALACSSLREIL